MKRALFNENQSSCGIVLAAVRTHLGFAYCVWLTADGRGGIMDIDMPFLLRDCWSKTFNVGGLYVQCLRAERQVEDCVRVKLNSATRAVCCDLFFELLKSLWNQWKHRPSFWPPSLTMMWMIDDDREAMIDAEIKRRLMSSRAKSREPLQNPNLQTEAVGIKQ